MRSPGSRAEIMDALHEPLMELIVWNAPDHAHTRSQSRAWLDEALDEAFAVYETMGGDVAQGLAPA